MFFWVAICFLFFAPAVAWALRHWRRGGPHTISVGASDAIDEFAKPVWPASPRRARKLCCSKAWLCGWWGNWPPNTQFELNLDYVHDRLKIVRYSPDLVRRIFVIDWSSISGIDLLQPPPDGLLVDPPVTLTIEMKHPPTVCDGSLRHGVGADASIQPAEIRYARRSVIVKLELSGDTRPHLTQLLQQMQKRAIEQQHTLTIGLPGWSHLLHYRFTAFMYSVRMRSIIQSTWGRLLIVYVTVSLALALYQLYEALPFLRLAIRPFVQWLRHHLGRVAEYVSQFLAQFNWLTLGIVVPFRNMWNAFVRLWRPAWMLIVDTVRMFAPLVRGVRLVFASTLYVLISACKSSWTVLRSVALALRAAVRLDSVVALFSNFWAMFRQLLLGVLQVFQQLKPLRDVLYRLCARVWALVSMLARPNINRVVNARQFLVDHTRKLVGLSSQVTKFFRRGKRTSLTRSASLSPNMMPLSPTPVPAAPLHVAHSRAEVKGDGGKADVPPVARRAALRSSTVRALRL
eukprot:TRINITY_DN2641_c0_g1_i1.p1 TRINITY_DN2641_c0_g1~~TRINITY_DN2641_c0_g1_i1.p1  ORF type:complete len:515 (+),score=72.33 TRINITY_DN2641_c0_g1_i1:101-1645(+)